MSEPATGTGSDDLVARRDAAGYALEDLDPGDPPSVYNTGEVAARFDEASVKHDVGEMRLTDEEAEEALIYPLVIDGEINLTTETQGSEWPYAAMTVGVTPEQARDVAAALLQAAEDVERIRGEGGV
ncbi:hypothetical protein [Halorubrum aethiopicum]|uniref:hypothetical protein n=1 Tax=Halorubrum aethiopicum TaxID=1758255 RepID=UPI0008319D9F|nr:hypothetical protein [Halorubrum aethiopicum]